MLQKSYIEDYEWPLTNLIELMDSVLLANIPTSWIVYASHYTLFGYIHNKWR